MVSSSGQARQQALLERLRDRYESEGYEFLVHPPRDLVPPFLGEYRPDALALRGKGGVVIEVKTGIDRDKGARLSELAKRFVGQKDWAFKVLAAQADQRHELRLASVSELESQFAEFEALAEQGHLRAALLLGWSVLEAATRLLLEPGDEQAGRWPLIADELPELLAHHGFIDQASARDLRELGRIRNAAAHGDFTVRIDRADLQSLCEAVRTVMSNFGNGPT